MKEGFDSEQLRAPGLSNGMMVMDEVCSLHIQDTQVTAGQGCFLTACPTKDYGFTAEDNINTLRHSQQLACLFISDGYHISVVN